MPLFFHRQSSLPTTAAATSPSYSSKLLKPLKPHPAPVPTRTPLPIIVFSLVSLFIGLAGTIFAVAAFRRPTPIPIFRWGKSDDTFRGFYSLSKSRQVGDKNGGLVDRPKLLGFVGIQTGFGSADRRAALRNTWFSSDPDGLSRLEQATGLAFRFVIGRSKDAKKMAELQKEIDKYRDFLVIDINEEYLNLPWKTSAFFKAAFQLFEADYYVKANDDIYLRPDRLATLLAKERTHPQTYIGCMKKGTVVTDPKMKCYENSGHLIGKEYFQHAFGPFYILSAEVVASLLNARNNRLAFFKAAFQLFEADYYVKANDDIYLRPDQLATLLAKERTHPQTYIGCMKKGPVVTDPKMKWYEKSGHLIGNEYFQHAFGPIYVLSAEVVASLAVARNNSLRMYSNEDVTIGSWMLAMNVNHEDNRALCDPRCTLTSIAVWDIPKCSGLCNPAIRLRELHAMRMCSKSPTLPPDDR